MAQPITAFVDVTAKVAGALAERFDFGRLLGAFSHSITVNRIDGPYTEIAEVNAAGFTSAAAPEVNAWASTVFSQENPVRNIFIGRKDVGDANWTATLDAIETAADAADKEFYGVTIESRAKADVLEGVAWCEARGVGDSIKFGSFQTADADVLSGGAGNVMQTAKDASRVRCILTYHQTSTGTDGYTDAAAIARLLGFQLDEPGGVGVLAHKTLKVPYSPLTSGQATAIHDAGGNYFGRKRGLNFLWPGQTPSGAPRFADITTTIDWFRRRVEEFVLEFFVGQPTKVGYNRAGIEAVANVVQTVCDIGVKAGHFLGDPGAEPVVHVPKLSEIAAADKKARILRLTSTANKATFDGAIQSLKFNINIDYASLGA